MRVPAFLRRIGSKNHHFMPVFAQQATYLIHASAALCEMTETLDPVKWRKLEREIKACEVQGDALLTEFHEQLFEVILGKLKKSDLQAIAMNIDEFLDAINDSAKSITLYMPKRIDSQIADLAQYAHSEADAIKKLMLLMGDVKKNYAQIAVQCERITELEHAADDAFAEYIGYIFTHETDAIELMKYKNIAETFEEATDSAKRLSDSVRKMIMRYTD
ncbi:MAG: DUF47 family protein [Bacteroidales bacterium]|nr:DUF47 family protein [Bacteroidales bacterium]